MRAFGSIAGNLLVLSLTLLGCGKDGNGNTGGDADADSDADSDSDADADADSDADADFEADGNLTDGEVISIGWADDNPIFCWPGNENDEFDGAHVFFEVDKEGDDGVIVRVNPDNGVNVSLYTLEFDGDYQYPPDVSSPTRCESSAGNSGNEEIELLGFPENKLLVGVAGANGATSGGFTVTMTREHLDIDTAD